MARPIPKGCPGSLVLTALAVLILTLGWPQPASSLPESPQIYWQLTEGLDGATLEHSTTPLIIVPLRLYHSGEFENTEGSGELGRFLYFDVTDANGNSLAGKKVWVGEGYNYAVWFGSEPFPPQATIDVRFLANNDRLAGSLGLPIFPGGYRNIDISFQLQISDGPATEPRIEKITTEQSVTQPNECGNGVAANITVQTSIPPDESLYYPVELEDLGSCSPDESGGWRCTISRSSLDPERCGRVVIDPFYDLPNVEQTICLSEDLLSLPEPPTDCFEGSGDVHCLCELTGSRRSRMPWPLVLAGLLAIYVRCSLFRQETERK